MKRVKAYLLILAMLSLGLIYLPPISQGLTTYDINIHIPVETPQDSVDMQIRVAGIWHEVNISLGETPANLTIIVYHGDSVPTVKNTSNYYEYWYRSQETHNWIDPEYGSFVNTSLCNIEGNDITFGIGVDQDTPYGQWTMSIADDVTVLDDRNVSVVRPRIGLSMSGGDFVLRGEPFTAGNISSYPDGGYALVTNMGNVPLRTPVTFSTYAGRITMVNLTHKLGPGESANLNILFKADSWSPRKISISGTVRGEAMYIIPSGTVSLTSNYETALSLKVNIGRSGMELGDLGNVRIQYNKSASIAWNDTLVLDVWLSGTTTIDLKISSNMLDIKSITMDGEVSSSTASDLQLTEDSEYHFVITAYPKKTNTKGFVNYEVSGEQVETTIFSTEVDIGPEIEENETNNTIVLMKTSMGNLKIQLYPNSAPITVSNFLKYVNASFYDDLIFHRVIDDFVIQGGGFYPDMTPKTPLYPPIPLEINESLLHLDGALAMARTSDPNSATCQYYICDGSQSFLDGSYAVFGQVVSGMDVVRAIAQVPTHSESYYNDVPVEDIIIHYVDFDSDQDLVGDKEDAFPTDSTQSTDTDGDGYGDNQTGNNPDAFKNEPTQWSDMDGDGYGDNSSGNDPDSFPEDATEWSDNDNDSIGDNADDDDDNDGMPDEWEEKYGLNKTDPTDADEDLDGDGFSNIAEFKAGKNPFDASSKPGFLYNYWWTLIIVGLILTLIAVLFMRRKQPSIHKESFAESLEEEGEEQEKGLGDDGEEYRTEQNPPE